MGKQGKGILYAGMILAILAAMFVSVSSVTGNTDSHSELSEQEMLVSCADCHKEATPEIEKEWFNSVHGIGMVKCYQCHGTFENLVVTPSKADCAVCHVNMLEKEKDKPCWECHVPHSFKEKK